MRSASVFVSGLALGVGMLTACTGGMDKTKIHEGNGATAERPERQIAEPCVINGNPSAECKVVISDLPGSPTKSKDAKK